MENEKIYTVFDASGQKWLISESTEGLGEVFLYLYSGGEYHNTAGFWAVQDALAWLEEQGLMAEG